MKRLYLVAVAALLGATVAVAQRMTDQLDRGLVAVQTQQGVYCSWRVLAEEYYDVTYNLYRDGVKVNDEPLAASNFTDAGGTSTSQYTVRPVVRGVETAAGKAATVWAQNYLEIKPDHGALTSTYVPNDACCADVDGDGELEILLKFDNQSWASASYPREGHNGEYFIIEVYKLNGTKLWWVDLGPNMADFQNNEQNIVAYDWDQDGRAEAVMRAADGTVIHMASGETYTIGDASKNYLGATNTNQWFVHEGAEFLVYMDGQTGQPYQVLDYPLKRLENGETDLNAAWGDGYGHRSTKHFFGAPYLDGRHPSIFLARGIYTRHKMVALDVNPQTHELTERWRWTCNNSGSAWYGQGYHNYAIADVDWDGRDEICFGSMVIDDNGHGLSTTGLGHGDAQHHGDFNPYVHGHEIYACNEDAPNNNFRDATTSKIYYRSTGTNDDGRAMCGNFTNDYPGAIGLSSRDEPISCVTNGHVPGLTKAAANVTQNMRIYWDGDLLDESFDYSNGKNTAGAIYKYGQSGALEVLTGSMTNNDTKGTPCYQGDVLGDWREEVIMRTRDNNIRIYTTTIPTDWRLPSLWYDHQYRQAMVWQMCGYNQPPHVSYFVGELEGITQAPPPLTATRRIEVVDYGVIADVDTGNPHWLLAETKDATVTVEDGCKPYIVTVNTPSWVQGHDNNDNITTEYYTHTLTGGAFAGPMRLVKQGDGRLVLPTVVQAYSGPTDVWAGTLRFDGTMQQSHVWLNRFATLESDGGRFLKGISMDYAATLQPGGSSHVGTVEADTLRLGFGARVVFDATADGQTDLVKARAVSIETKDWQYGPQYSAPVFEVVRQGLLPEGKYLLVATEQVDGNVADIVLEGLDGQKASLVSETDGIYLVVQKMRDAGDITWDGGADGVWDFASTSNFLLADGTQDVFVAGDVVTFDDQATQTTVTLVEDVAPAGVVFNNHEKAYTLTGDGAITGAATLSLQGTGDVTIRNVNRLTGGVSLQGGRLMVSQLANTDGTDYGALGGVDNQLTFSGGTLAVTSTATCSQPVLMDGEGTFDVSGGRTLTLNGKLTQTDKSVLTKAGTGTLVLGGSVKLNKMVVDKGVVQSGEVSNIHQYPDTVVLNDGTLKDADNIYSYSTNRAHVVVPAGKTATWTLDSRCDYKGKLLGSGTLTVNVTSIRCNMQGDWSQFEGTIKFQTLKTGSYDPVIQWNNTKGLGKATVTGVFDNGGNNVAVGTLDGNCTLTGGGTYTARNLSATITKTRGNNSNTCIEVAQKLAVTDTIRVTLRGSTPKVGEQFTLWKVGTLAASASVVLVLPELPSGLYWDTSALLANEGVLSVTDVEPLSIGSVHGLPNDGRTYTIWGTVVEEPLRPGIYIRNGKKIVVK